MRRKDHNRNELLIQNYSEFICFLESECFEFEPNSYLSWIQNKYNLDDWHLKFTGHNIIGFMWMNLRNPVNNKIYVDNLFSFNKTGQCPFQKNIPIRNKFEEYLKRFKFWGTKEGKELSESFDQRDVV